ncbi:hypothetical protein CI109_101544 [Kwoniella shandongensis]|uniref:Dol-P-Man:Man(5)GlcNAc(2)-PP-Dol alpha-1,3-mannosyltransferase n=1 Tax=Kwoniella shandongensis TaxID=1734106 RepID=A0A5M6C751_9TREE|nr:uncharacterized protein CI109_001324 [Kwoniella shandongensis]KAA5530520.1 hypothetical protein CI109_001324 [Kwoniella shandongensis]
MATRSRNPFRSGLPYSPSHGTNVMLGGLFNLVKSFLFDRQYFWHFAGLLAVGELVLGTLIIQNVPYTKIDWPAYMQQVGMFLGGERDYSRIEGETGPLVYPALHLYIYSAFHRFLPSPDSIRPAQYVFLIFYIVTFLLVATIYYLAGRPSKPNAIRRHYPQALLIPLALSKRAHSIFLLRLFNDPIAMLFFYAAVVVMMSGKTKSAWRIGVALFSLALGVKMNILLFVPGLLVLLFQYRGIYGLLEGAVSVAAIQALLAAPFLSLANPHLTKAYITSAFDLSRQFLYEWTVNWRFVAEKTFLSRERAVLLLAGHFSIILLFAFFKWSPVPGGTIAVLQYGFNKFAVAPLKASSLPSSHIPLVLFTANLIGMTFARSLHYQFHSWYFHQLPFLLYSGGAWGSPILGIALWASIEWAWATFPSTVYSSAALLISHIVILTGLFFSSPSAQANKVEVKKATIEKKVQ